MIQIKTGFWIRLVARVFDLLFISTIAIGFLFMMMNHNNGWTFKQDWMFYIWILMYSAMIFTWFIVIPTFTDGQTLFMWIFRIQIIFEDKNKLTSMLRREIFFSLMWILMLALIATIVNHTLIAKYATTHQKGITYTDLEKLRTGTVTAIGSVLTVIQFIFAMSIFVRGVNKGLHDTQSNTWTVWKNKFTKKDSEKTEIKIAPKPVNNNPVIWID